MTEFLTVVLAAILVMLAASLVRVLRGPGDADRMMAAQLVGSCGIAALLLIGAIGGMAAAVDVALVLALLATFASAAFAGHAGTVTGTAPRPDASPGPEGP